MANEVSTYKRSSQEAIDDIQSQHATRKKRLSEAQTEELKNIRTKHKEQVKEINEHQEAAVNHIQSRHNSEKDKLANGIEDMRERNQENYAKVQKRYQNDSAKIAAARDEAIQGEKERLADSVINLRERNSGKIEEEQARGQSLINNTKNKYKEAYVKVKNNGESKIDEVRKSQNETLLRENESAKIKTEKLRNQTQKEYETLRTNSNDKLQIEREHNEAQLRELKDSYQQRSNETTDDWISRIQNQNEKFAIKMEDDKAAQQNVQKRQNEKFGSFYDLKEDQNRKALDVQQSMYDKAINKQKFRHIDKFDKYKTLEQDPFYKVMDRGSILRENKDYYFVDAFVPDHEKDKVKVSVIKGKVTIAGTRAFNEKIDLEDKKLATNSYQSFREEIPLKEPIVAEAIERERNGDYIRLTIPKLTGFKKDV